MLKLIVCVKQVPMVSELPWESRTRTLRRDLAEGMLNPACSHALEAALQLKEKVGAHITVITMGPPMAEEVLFEALALGADRGVLLTDRRMAGSDTFATSFILARAIEKTCPDFDLVLCGCYTSDSETSQVGPQLVEELNIPGHPDVMRDHIREPEQVVGDTGADTGSGRRMPPVLNITFAELAACSEQNLSPGQFRLAGHKCCNILQLITKSERPA